MKDKINYDVWYFLFNIVIIIITTSLLGNPHSIIGIIASSTIIIQFWLLSIIKEIKNLKGVKYGKRTK
jgi:hypothetical protein